VDHGQPNSALRKPRGSVDPWAGGAQFRPSPASRSDYPALPVRVFPVRSSRADGSSHPWHYVYCPRSRGSRSSLGRTIANRRSRDDEQGRLARDHRLELRMKCYRIGSAVIGSLPVSCVGLTVQPSRPTQGAGSYASAQSGTIADRPRRGAGTRRFSGHPGCGPPTLQYHPHQRPLLSRLGRLPAWFPLWPGRQAARLERAPQARKKRTSALGAQWRIISELGFGPSGMRHRNAPRRSFPTSNWHDRRAPTPKAIWLSQVRTFFLGD
jgi:hypothetical protein